jgi:hypothetical protein
MPEHFAETGDVCFSRSRHPPAAFREYESRSFCFARSHFACHYCIRVAVQSGLPRQFERLAFLAFFFLAFAFLGVFFADFLLTTWLS